MDDRSSAVGLIALVRAGQVLTVHGDGGVTRLPGAVTWPDLSEIAAECAVSTVAPLGPSRRVDVANVVVHVVTSGDSPDLLRSSWTPIDELVDAGVPAPVRDAIARTVAENDGIADAPPSRPDWFHRDWDDQVDRWIDACLAERGIERLGPTTVASKWSLSAVLRTPVDRGHGRTDVWFKASCAWFRAEAAVTAAVSRFAAAHVPSIVAVDADAGGC